MLKQARYSGAQSADAVKASVSWARQPDADADGARGIARRRRA